MDLTPTQLVAATLQIALIVIGAWLLVTNLAPPLRRKHWLGHNRLAHWEITGPEVVLLAVLIFLCGSFLQIAATQGYHALAGTAPARGGSPPGITGPEVLLFGLSFHLGGLLAWPLFARMRRGMFAGYGVPPAKTATAPRLRPTKLFVAAATTVVAVFPALALVGLAWTSALNAAGFPVEPQALIGAFADTKSPLLFAGMMLVACVVAPLNEELLFRRGIFHFLRQRFGRAPALLASGLLFGAIHGHLAGFPSLSLLGIGLALAYEKTGDIRVPIVAHGLFNLNSILIVLLGLGP